MKKGITFDYAFEDEDEFELDEEDVYSKLSRDEMLEEDEMSVEEEAFMEGYEDAE